MEHVQGAGRDVKHCITPSVVHNGPIIRLHSQFILWVLMIQFSHSTRPRWRPGAGLALGLTRWTWSPLSRAPKLMGRQTHKQVITVRLRSCHRSLWQCKEASVYDWMCAHVCLCVHEHVCVSVREPLCGPRVERWVCLLTCSLRPTLRGTTRVSST